MDAADLFHVGVSAPATTALLHHLRRHVAGDLAFQGAPS